MEALSLFLTAFGNVLRLPFDLLLGIKRRRYEATVLINAAPETVWDVLTADVLEIEGTPKLTLMQAPVDGDPTLIDNVLQMGTERYVARSRTLKEVPNTFQSFEMLSEGSDPRVDHGENYFLTNTLEALPAPSAAVPSETDAANEAGGAVSAAEALQTKLTVVHELDHTTLGGRITVPIGMAQMTKRLARTAEREAGRTPLRRPMPIRAALLTGLVTLVSFAALFGWTFAAVLLVIILIHELGHVIAMRWCGLPVRGIYFVPFLGGVAVAKEAFRGQGERGFVALMGPGMSVLTTGLLLAAAEYTGSRGLYALTFVSAMINGLNLLPVLPLDGGQIIGALFSRSDPKLRHGFELALLGLGFAAALYYQLWFTSVLAGIVLFALIQRTPQPETGPLITGKEQVWLTVGYIATAAFYAVVGMWALTPTFA